MVLHITVKTLASPCAGVITLVAEWGCRRGAFTPAPTFLIYLYFFISHRFLKDSIDLSMQVAFICYLCSIYIPFFMAIATGTVWQMVY